MKKTKILTLLAALPMLGSTTLTLTSCGDKDTDITGWIMDFNSTDMTVRIDNATTDLPNKADVTIPSKVVKKRKTYTVTEVGAGAFNQIASSLTKVTLPNTIKKIGVGAFGECNSLATAIFEDETHVWSLAPATGESISTDVFKIGGSKAAELLRNTYKDYTWDRTETKVSLKVTSALDQYITKGQFPDSVVVDSDFNATFTVANGRSINLNKCDIIQGGASIKTLTGVEITNNSIKIPHEHYRNFPIEITLNTQGQEYKVDKELDSGFTSSNFPKAYDHADYIATYTLNSNKTIDTANCVIKAGNDDITSHCTLTKTQLTIPGEYVTGNLTITLKSKSATQYTVTTTGTEITFTIASQIGEGEELSGTYTYDNTLVKIDEDNCDILVGGTSIKSQSGVEYKKGKIKIPGSLITGNVTINIAIKLVPGALDLTIHWSNILAACEKYEASSRTASDKQLFFNAFTRKKIKMTSLDELIGSTFLLSISGLEYVVRIIDFEHDTIASGTYANQKAALTMELVTLLNMGDSEFGGDTSDYTNSVLRANLTGEGTGTKTFSKTVLSVLDADLQTGAKIVKKDVAKWDGSKFVMDTYNDRLFPLTYTEMGMADAQYAAVEGTTYNYWSNHKQASDRIKKSYSGNAYAYGLASPYINGNGVVWYVKENGSTNGAFLTTKLGVSFAFCF